MITARCSKWRFVHLLFILSIFTLVPLFQPVISSYQADKQHLPPLRRQMSPDFVPFELLNVTSRWTYGRTEAGNSSLAQYVTDHADQYWSAMNRAFDDYVRQRSEVIRRQWRRTVVKDDLVKGGQVSQKCFDVLQEMIDKPLETEWSVKMIDSMGSLPIGLLSTNMVELGDFDQCLSVDGQSEGGMDFVGKYCLATVNLPRKAYQPVTYNASVLGAKWKVDAVELWHQLDNKYSISVGICFPSLCRENEIRAVMRSYYEILQWLEFNVTTCQARDKPRQYSNQKIWVAVTILAIPMFLVLLSLVVDLCCGFPNTDDKTSKKSKFLLFQALHCFSPIANTQRLVRMEDTSSSLSTKEEKVLKKDLQSGRQKFHFISGFRALSSVTIVCSHTAALVAGSQVSVLPFARYLTDYRTGSRAWFYQPLANSGLLVHTFFLLSGLLMTYRGLNKRGVKIGYLSFLLFRWLRYTPLLIGALALTVVLELFGSGPLFHTDQLSFNLDRCYEYWWANLLYVQNFLPLDANCSIPSWTLAADMQIHLVAYVLLVVYAWRGSRATYIVSGLFIALQLVAQSVVLLSGLARPTMFTYYAFTFDIYPEFEYSNRVFYLFTFNVLLPYFVGAIIGQMLLEGVVLKPSPKITKLLWIITSLITVFFFTHTYSLMQTPEEELVIFLPGTMATAVTLFAMTFLWSAVSGWAIYQCAINPGNALSRFLSAQIFQPFSRLSFSLSLGHIMITWFNVLQTRTTVSLTPNGVFQQISSVLVLSYLVAFYLYLTWEAPFANLIRLLWPTSKEKKKIIVNEMELNKKKN